MTVRPACDDDYDALMTWFADAAATRQWAGPRFRFPFDRRSFLEDLRLDSVLSYSMLDDAAVLLGFGQCYARWGRMHLARLAVSPWQRGAGNGRALSLGIMQHARRDLALDEFSLFVYRDNAAAIALYKSLGFATTDSPGSEPHLEHCDYMIRAAER